MIIMGLKINNFYSFKDFEINFSYPRKIKNSLIEHEFIEEIPNFRFKKLNIIMGSNSAGKTTFGKMLRNVFNFIAKQRVDLLLEAVNKEDKEAMFELDIVLKEEDRYNLYRLKVVVEKIIINEDEERLNIKRMTLSKVTLNVKDSYERAIKRLEVVKKYSEDENETNEAGKILDEINGFGWFFNFPQSNSLTKKIKNLNVAGNILKTFDNTIENIKEIENTENGYQIIFKNRDSVLLQNGKVVDKDILSSGTEEALGIVFAIDQMIQEPNRPFYIDEKFSHAHSELEKSILSIMIDIMGNESQLFFTTHNIDILTMNFPTHSFTFLSKDKEGEIKVTYPEDMIKRNDRNLINYVKNNVFDTVPDDELIYDIIDIVNEKRNETI
ncbi:ATP/GTP-binding protein [Leptotrichia trevisanii]|uniref:AAA family ATPase n=1 Tax=Leptotrichia trevisanii TaxID=109328 RepID=UPI0026ECA717|nr:AAA family ATPase [Leptotrichia trevisanii]